MYDYKEAMKADIKDYIEAEDIDVTTSDRDEIESSLEETLWLEDGVTGNASGSYTFNSLKAEEYVIDNLDLLEDACHEFGIDEREVGLHFLGGDFEWFDVTIRCWMLAECLSEVLDELEHDPEEEE